MAQLQSYDKAVTQTVDRDWKSVTWQPARRAEYDYFNTPYAGGNNAWSMAICFTGTPGATYSVEYVVKMEYLGYFVRGKTPTPAYPETVRIIASLANLRSADWQPYLSGAMSTSRFLMDAYRTVYQPQLRNNQRLLTY